MKKQTEIDILKTNIRDLEKQLHDAYKRINELNSEKQKYAKEYEEEKEFIKAKLQQMKELDDQAKIKIQKQIDEWPDIIDSKPSKEMRFKNPNSQPKWSKD